MIAWMDEVDMEGGINEVFNPSFEVLSHGELVGWNLPDSGCSVDETNRRTGRRSLKYENRDPTVYRLITQRVDLQPGKRYALVAWVKTENVEGPGDGGAGICIEWVDEEGKWLGGVYPSCLRGTSDWRPVGTIFTCPEEARGRRVAGAHIVLYLRKGTTGAAWFDDVQLREMIEPSLRAILIDPSYRGIVRAGEARKITVEATSQEDGRLLAKLDKEEIKVCHLTKGRNEIIIDLPRVKPGKHTLALILLDDEDEEIGYDSLTIDARQDDWFEESVFFDERRMTVISGERFFPIGIYLGPTEDEHLQRLAGIGINTILCYGYGTGPDPLAYMDRAAKYGLKVIYSIKDIFRGTRYYPSSIAAEKDDDEVVEEYVRMLKSHPALLAWYINDELPLEWLPSLRARYELVASLDPRHPTFQALCRPAEFEHYYDTLDVIGPDPYPIPRHPVDRVASYVDEAMKAMRGVKPVWVIPQIFSWRVYSGDPQDRDPTYEEERCMTYLALIHGATGVVYYSYYDLFTVDRSKNLKASPELFEERFSNLRRLVGELNLIAPLLLDGDPVDVASDPQPNLHLKAVANPDRLIIMAANSGTSDAEVLVRLPDEWKGAVEYSTLSGESGRTENGELRDLLNPLGCRTYLIGK